MMVEFYKNLDQLIWSASDIQRRMPMDPARLQTLVKRHLPTSEAAKLEVTGGRRPYTGRMVIWLSVINTLMDLGIASSVAAEMTYFVFGGHMDHDYRILAANSDEAEICRIGRTIAVAHPVSLHEERPMFALMDIDNFQAGSASLTIPLGSILLDLGSRFDNRNPARRPDIIAPAWLS